jgi:hypothetical protein
MKKNKIYLLISGLLFINSIVYTDGDISIEGSIFMNNSTEQAIGNIFKNGSSFIHNSGKANTFVGYDAGSLEIIGFGNSGFGTDSLFSITTGMGNTGIGFSALSENLQGNGNTALGIMSVSSNEYGCNNTALGAYALHLHNEGSNNIALGAQAGLFLTNGSNNIYIAHNGINEENNTIRIGAPGIHTSTFIQGMFTSSSTAYSLPVEINSQGKLSIQQSNQQNINNIQPISDESSLIYQLNPVSFNYNADSANDNKNYGFVAEEVALVSSDLIVLNANNNALAVRSQQLIPLLLKEIQKQQQMILMLTERLELLENKLSQ